VREYVLRVAPGGTVNRHRIQVMSGVELGPGGKPQSMKDVAGLDAMLLSECLFDVTDNEDGVFVTVAVLDAWPERIVKPLVEKLKEISSMKEEEEVEKEEADDTSKND